VANLRDIIASKRASNREKDLLDLLLLEEFRLEYEKAPRATSRNGRRGSPGQSRRIQEALPEMTPF